MRDLAMDHDTDVLRFYGIANRVKVCYRRIFHDVMQRIDEAMTQAG